MNTAAEKAKDELFDAIDEALTILTSPKDDRPMNDLTGPKYTARERFAAATARLVCEQLDAQKQIILGPRLTREHVERILKDQMDRFNVQIPDTL